MSEQEKFLDRWSRRKRDAAELPAQDVVKDTAVALPPRETKAAAANPPFDPASLPPIESITAESDIGAFLQAGVPSALKHAALRRAWSADPQIRDFIGLVENGWNFNDPVGVPGFGPMSAGEDMGRLLAQAVGTAPPPDNDATKRTTMTPDKSRQVPLTAEVSAPSHRLPQDHPAPRQDLAPLENDAAQHNKDDAAVQNDSDGGDNVSLSRRRRQGGALPK